MNRNEDFDPHSLLKYQRDVQVAAFTAFVQKMLIENDQIFEYQDLLYKVAQNLNIQEPFLTQIVQHQIENKQQLELDKDNLNRQIVVDNEDLSIKQFDSKFQHQQEKRFRRVHDQLNKDVLSQLKLYQPYKKFQQYYKNGCSLEDLKKLKQEFINALLQQINEEQK